MKMDLRMKASLIVLIVSFLAQDHACCRLLEELGLGKVVNLRDANGKLTREGAAIMSSVLALITYVIMSRPGRK